MRVVEKRIQDLRPYENNPRKNEAAVDKVAASIREFGFKVPLVITQDGEIVAGHTRLKAAESIGLKKVPCIIADDLKPEQIKAFRLADNKTAEFSSWDADLLALELEAFSEIDMSVFGFDADQIETWDGEEWFEKREKYNSEGIDEEDEEYKEFIEKFKAKKTTDDCYTPNIVYDAVAAWVEKEYNVKREKFVRPFYPGGDYQAHKYKQGDIVVDNPPFSILSEIIKFYDKKKIRFFLFAPSLVLFSSSSSSSSSSSAIVAYCEITYENGATIRTSFLTNLEDEEIRARTAPELNEAVRIANNENLKEQRREVPKYEYPPEVLTAAMMGQWSMHGVDYKLTKKDSHHIRALDEQKKQGKAIFGSGYLISEKAAAEKAAAEKAAAEKAAAEKTAAEKWRLSEEEMAIVRSLG